MTNYKWKHRPLLVFSQDEQSGLLTEQRRMVEANRAALRERDVVVIYVTGDKVVADLGPSPDQTASQLAARFNSSEVPFRAILIGKDGGTKLTSVKPITPRLLLDTIDAMPMRQNEMRR